MMITPIITIDDGIDVDKVNPIHNTTSSVADDAIAIDVDMMHTVMKL
jgi:hypothetical protein